MSPFCHRLVAFIHVLFPFARLSLGFTDLRFKLCCEFVRFERCFFLDVIVSLFAFSFAVFSFQHTFVRRVSHVVVVYAFCV